MKYMNDYDLTRAVRRFEHTPRRRALAEVPNPLPSAENDRTERDWTSALAEQMERVAVLIDYQPTQPHPAPEVEHRDDMAAPDALWECYDLWASGAWDDRNAEYHLEEVEQHLARFREERESERARHLDTGVLPPESRDA